MLVLALTVADEEDEAGSMETPSLSRVDAGMANGICRVDSLSDVDDGFPPPCPPAVVVAPIIVLLLLLVARRVQDPADGPDDASEGRAALPLVSC